MSWPRRQALPNPARFGRSYRSASKRAAFAPDDRGDPNTQLIAAGENTSPAVGNAGGPGNEAQPSLTLAPYHLPVCCSHALG